LKNDLKNPTVLIAACYAADCEAIEDDDDDAVYPTPGLAASIASSVSSIAYLD